ncbi:MAG TPA: hypothetical protein VIV58_18000, partial [Kofleriaceae bacterium]
MSTRDPDEEPTNVSGSPGTAGPPDSEAHAGGVAPAPATGEAPKKAMWQPQTTVDAPKEDVSVAKAVGTGFRDAFAPIYRFLDMIGGHLILIGKALVWLPRRPFRGQTYLEAAEYIGFGSLPIVLLVGAATGMVLWLQSVNA